MHIQEFRDLFGPEIRAALNWTILEEKCSASIEIITTPAELRGLETVWHVNESGALGDWRDQCARRLTLSDAAQNVRILPTANQTFINSVEQEFRNGMHPRVWGVPLYCTNEGRHIILDGNHRLTALLRSAAPIRILGAVVYGFDSEDLLPDLLHDCAKKVSALSWRSRVTAVNNRLAKSNIVASHR